MQNETKEMQEALKVMLDFINKLIPSMKEVLNELRDGRKEGTAEYLQKCLDGLNWTVAVCNQTIIFINEDKERISKNSINEKLLKLGTAIEQQNDKSIADTLDADIIPFLIRLKTSVCEVLFSNNTL